MKTVIMESLGVSDEVLAEKEKPFKEKGMEFVHYTRNDDIETLKKEAAEADVMILANMPITKEVLAAAPHLQFVNIGFTGVDHVDIGYCRDNHIAVSNASGYATEPVAELAVGDVISLYRCLFEADKRARAGKTKAGLSAREIKGKTVGIIGLGKIGMRTAELFHAFGAEILANKKHPCPEPEWITLTSVEEIMKKCDIVVLNCPLNDETRHMINAERIAMMKKDAVLVNMARGAVVDNKALAEALQAGRIAGAAIDVFDKEPPLDETEPLLKCENALLTPHIGFYSQEAMLMRADIIFDNLAAWLDHKQKNIILQ